MTSKTAINRDYVDASIESDRSSS